MANLFSVRNNLLTPKVTIIVSFQAKKHLSQEFLGTNPFPLQQTIYNIVIENQTFIQSSFFRVSLLYTRSSESYKQTMQYHFECSAIFKFSFLHTTHNANDLH